MTYDMNIQWKMILGGVPIAGTLNSGPILAQDQNAPVHAPQTTIETTAQPNSCELNGG